MRKPIAAVAAVVGAALLVSSIGAATTAKPPKRWLGTALYTYTFKDNERSVQQTVNASVVFSPAGRGWTSTYQVTSGTLKSDYLETTSDGCKTVSSGTYPALKGLAVLQLALGRPRTASFSGSEGATKTLPDATRTCSDGTSETTQGAVAVVSPFFMLSRHTAGFPINASVTKIAGSVRTAQAGAVWTVRFSLVGQR